MRDRAILTKSSTFEFVFMISMSLLILAFLIGIGSCHDSVQRFIFFRQGADLFADFLNPIKWVSHTYFTTGYAGAEPAFYPAMPLLFFYPFSLLANSGGIAYKIMSVFIFLLIPTILITILLYESKTGTKVKRLFIVFLLLFSGIYLTSLERANICFYSSAALFSFLALYKTDNKIWREIALVALAVAASIKIYPVIFVILLLLEKRFFEFFRFLIYAILITFVPFLIMHGGLSNVGLYLTMAKKLMIYYSNESPELKFGYNGFIPVIAMFFPKLSFLINFINPLKFILTIFSILSIFHIESYWKKLLLLTILTIVLPNPSFIYTCLNLFFPIILFLNEKEHPISDWKYLILMIIILSPFQFVAPDGFLLTIIYVNIAILIIQLLLCIEGVSSFFKKNYKQREIIQN